MSCFTYFLQEEYGGPIKIGKAADLQKRVDALQTGNHRRLILIGLMNSDIESCIHQRFSSCRCGGEWFRPTRKLIKYIREKASTFQTRKTWDSYESLRSLQRAARENGRKWIKRDSLKRTLYRMSDSFCWRQGVDAIVRQGAIAVILVQKKKTIVPVFQREDDLENDARIRAMLKECGTFNACGWRLTAFLVGANGSKGMQIDELAKMNPVPTDNFESLVDRLREKEQAKAA